MMMLKLLIAAWLITHSLGRPDVSHLFKQNQTGQRLRQQNKSSFLEYLDSLNGTNVNELNAQASSGFDSRNGQLREFIQPSPFKRNTEEQGYTYEKPTVGPFDYPVNPDANLIKPVSTQAPEYLPPSELESFTSTVDKNLVISSSQAPAAQQSYPESTYSLVVVGENGDHSSTSKPVDIYNVQPSTQPQDGYSKQEEFTSRGPTQESVTQTDAIGSRFENGYTGYTQEPMASTLDTFNGQEPVEGDNGYSYVKPDQPQIPNLDEKIGEPLDINELATTTAVPVTTRKYNGHIIPPKPLSELNGPTQYSTPQAPEETYAPVTASVQITTRSDLGNVGSTSAPEYLPPDGSHATEGQGEVPEKPQSYDQNISNRFDQDTTTVGYNQETAATSGYPDISQDNKVDSGSFSSSQGTTPADVGYTSLNQETFAPESASVSTVPAERPSSSSSESTSVPEYTSIGQPSTYEPFNDAPADGFTPSYRPNNEPLYSTVTSGQYDLPTSTSAPDYLPPGSEKPEGFHLPSAGINDGGFTSPTEQPNYSGVPSANRLNIPTETSIAPTDSRNAPVTSPESENDVGFSIVVEESTSSVPLELSSSAATSEPRLASTVDDTITTYHPSSTHKPLVESEAEESELKPRVSIDSPTTAYEVQQPTEGTQRPSPAGPSHTLESDGYHYKIPSIPFP
ncbi:uncharacterized protein LOC129771329 [Toxorhynchites rutilus septentrionalis]|uniref:uncharacterized protein LOC129771329 n=1 Tax=Toxorhynchites rutilus septentrionalis TaxID=329112 RepID=UPI00247A9C75|nr:uncharacterized protein LOC129771329 [Toxorhynchites rutilus septentrionalis]